MTATRLFQSTLIALVISSIPVLAQTPAATGSTASPALAQAEQQLRSGQLDQALAAYQQALTTTPDSFEANQGAGIALDLMGKADDARAHFAKAAGAAAKPENAAEAERAMIVSYGFAGDCQGAEQYITKPYNADLDAGRFGIAADLAETLAQVCFNAGKLDAAEKWYRMAYASAAQDTSLKAPQQNLWEFRWDAAMARIDTIRGVQAAAKAKAEAAAKAEEAAKTDKDQDKKKDKKDKKKDNDKKDKNAKNDQNAKEANAKPGQAPNAEAKPGAAKPAPELKPLADEETPQKRMAAAAAALAKGVGDANAAQLSAWLTGSVAFDQGDYQKAATELAKADQGDPQVLALEAQAAEKQGDKAQAQTFYQKILASTAHTPANAWARPLAQKALGKA